MSMNRAEFLGAQLIMLIRREYEQECALAETRTKINDAYVEVQTMQAGQLYASTGELPRVASEPGRSSSAVTQARPMRTDHQDGGSTFALTPIADTVILAAQNQERPFLEPQK